MVVDACELTNLIRANRDRRRRVAAHRRRRGQPGHLAAGQAGVRRPPGVARVNHRRTSGLFTRRGGGRVGVAPHLLTLWWRSGVGGDAGAAAFVRGSRPAWGGNPTDDATPTSRWCSNSGSPATPPCWRSSAAITSSSPGATVLLRATRSWLLVTPIRGRRPPDPDRDDEEREPQAAACKRGLGAPASLLVGPPDPIRAARPCPGRGRGSTLAAETPRPPRRCRPDGDLQGHGAARVPPAGPPHLPRRCGSAGGGAPRRAASGRGRRSGPAGGPCRALRPTGEALTGFLKRHPAPSHVASRAFLAARRSPRHRRCQPHGPFATYLRHGDLDGWAGGGRGGGRPRRCRRRRGVFRSHYRSLVGLARLLVDDPSQAEEVVQDAFVSLHTRWHGVRDPLAYLRAAVANGARGPFVVRPHARAHLRRPSRRTRLGRTPAPCWPRRTGRRRRAATLPPPPSECKSRCASTAGCRRRRRQRRSASRWLRQDPCAPGDRHAEPLFGGPAMSEPKASASLQQAPRLAGRPPKRWPMTSSTRRWPEAARRRQAGGAPDDAAAWDAISAGSMRGTAAGDGLVGWCWRRRRRRGRGSGGAGGRPARGRRHPVGRQRSVCDDRGAGATPAHGGAARRPGGGGVVGPEVDPRRRRRHRQGGRHAGCRQRGWSGRDRGRDDAGRASTSADGPRATASHRRSTPAPTTAGSLPSPPTRQYRPSAGRRTCGGEMVPDPDRRRSAAEPLGCRPRDRRLPPARGPTAAPYAAAAALGPPDGHGSRSSTCTTRRTRASSLRRRRRRLVAQSTRSGRGRCGTLRSRRRTARGPRGRPRSGRFVTPTARHRRARRRRRRLAADDPLRGRERTTLRAGDQRVGGRRLRRPGVLHDAVPGLRRRSPGRRRGCRSPGPDTQRDPYLLERHRGAPLAPTSSYHRAAGTNIGSNGAVRAH